MIYYLVTSKHQYTMNTYLSTWGNDIKNRISVITYQDLQHQSYLPIGTYIFSDIERLTPSQVIIATHVKNQLLLADENIQILNDPVNSYRRYSLLDDLWHSKINNFRAIKLKDIVNEKIKYPVFLREENEHSGSLTGLIYNKRELYDICFQLLLRKLCLKNILVVEFCDTSDESRLYRKYAAFKIGSRIIPRQLIFSHKWVLKFPDLIIDQGLLEEIDYLDNNPHEEFLRDIFKKAKIEYGRIDYSLKNGKPQIWEINTNPMVMLRPEQFDSRHMEAQEIFSKSVLKAFEDIDNQEQTDKKISIDWDPEIWQQAKKEQRLLRKRKPIPFLYKLYVNYPSLFRPIGYLIQFAIWIRAKT